ncbi:MAG: YeeE/YedE family protein [Candidatus Heimdallarchaeota archaeon]|nr:YeeE/YedE family protein [Candidatus Heimdallarchaeota archaeon]
MSDEEQSIIKELYGKLTGKMSMLHGSILLAAMSTALFLLAQPFGASCAIINWGQNIYGWNNGTTIPDTFAMKCAAGVMILFFGAMAAAMISKEWALRIPPTGELVKGLVGGLFMGFGAVIGKGCTLGSFFSGWAVLSAGAIIFAFGLAIGAFIAAKWLLFEVEKWPGISSGSTKTLTLVPKNIQPIVGWLLLALALISPLFLGPWGKNTSTGWASYDIYFKADRVVIGFIIISALMGYILQRSRWCVVRALREPWMTGDSTAAVAIIAGIITGMIGMATYKFVNHGALVDGVYELSAIEKVFVFPHFWLRALIGGIIFGIGMTIAGGCAVGSIWRAAEGQVKLMISVLTMIFWMPWVAKLWIKDGKVTWLPDTQQKMVYLPQEIGYGWSIVVFIVLLFGWYMFAKWNERTGKFSAI